MMLGLILEGVVHLSGLGVLSANEGSGVVALRNRQVPFCSFINIFLKSSPLATVRRMMAI